MSTSAHVFPERLRSIHSQARSTGIPLRGNRGIKVMANCTIRASAAQLYGFCRKPENLPQILQHDVTVTPVEGRNSQWAICVPFDGRRVFWETALINDEPGRLIAWQSLEGAPVPNAGTLRFEPVPGGTDVVVQVEFDPPGKLAGFLAGMIGRKVKNEIEETLDRFKSLMERPA